MSELPTSLWLGLLLHHPFADHEHGMLIHSLVSYLFYTFWVHSCCSNTVLAFSRFVKIICPASRLSSLCTGRTSICVQALAVWLCSGLLALTTQFLLSCCRVQIDHHSYGYSYVRDEDAFNYSKYYVNLPANIIHTVIFCLFYASHHPFADHEHGMLIHSLVSYLFYTFWVHSCCSNTVLAFLGSKSITTATGTPIVQHILVQIIVFLWRHRMPIGSASRREFELAIQFLCIAAFFSLTWISFNILPTTRLRSLPATVMLEFDCAAAALIYLTMNRDIRRYLSKTDDRKNSQSGSNFRKTTIHTHCSSRRLRTAPAAVSL
ncbi:unnamed protein product, partial [Mesorhabditis spiculigera]